MSDLKLYLPTKEEEESPQQYVNKKLVPLAAELHRLTNQIIVRGSTEENSDIDMIAQHNGKQFAVVDTYVHTVCPKSCMFKMDKGEPMERNGKLAKVLFKATVYSDNGKGVAFRLSRVKDGKKITGSDIQTSSRDPIDVSLYLPIGDQPDRISPLEREYVIETKYVSLFARGICRRFSLSVVYA